MESVIQAQKLSRRFGRRWSVARVDLDVAPGERLLIIGGNGSGKTTLLRLLSTLLPPSQGQLSLFGQPAGGEVSALRRRIGVLSHQTGLYEDLSGADNLAVVAKLLGRSVPKDALEQVGLDAHRDDPIRVWSAGMRKRLALAALLLKEPELILLDEPFGQLDGQGMDAMSELIAKQPATVVVASHQVDRAAALCGRALLLEGGLPRWTGPAAQAAAAWRALQDQPNPGRVAG